MKIHAENQAEPLCFRLGIFKTLNFKCLSDLRIHRLVHLLNARPLQQHVTTSSGCSMIHIETVQSREQFLKILI